MINKETPESKVTATDLLSMMQRYGHERGIKIHFKNPSQLGAWLIHNQEGCSRLSESETIEAVDAADKLLDTIRGLMDLSHSAHENGVISVKSLLSILGTVSDKAQEVRDVLS